MYHIVFCGDENYIKFIAVVIYSIVINTDKQVSYKERLPYELVSGQGNDTEKYCFHIITDGILEETKYKLKEFESECNKIYPAEITLHYVDNALFAGYPKWNGSYGAYYRLSAADFLDSSVRYFLYLDGDVAAFSDIREIFLNDVGSVCLGAVAEEDRESMKKKLKKYRLKSRNGEADFDLSANDLYFNSGVLLINRQMWQDRAMKDNILNFLNKYYSVCADQDGLNAVIGDNFKKLGIEWNNFVYYDFEQNFKRLNALVQKYDSSYVYENTTKIRHYFIKPWNTDSRHFFRFRMITLPLIAEWWEYARNTPVFSREVLAVRDSEQYKRKIKKIESRAFRYTYFKPFYWLLRLKSIKIT